MYSSRRRSTENASPSKRWQTTSSSSQADTAALGNNDREAMVLDLKNRKIQNSKTNISFGQEKINYISDAAENQQKILNSSNAADRAEQFLRLKNMKAELTTTNFTLGDEIPRYESVNHSSMAIVESTDSPADRQALNARLKESIKKSSIHFGQEPVNYLSVSHQAMEYKGNQNSFDKMREDIKEMTTTLRKHNFSFGDEPVAYESDYQAGYGHVAMESYRTAGENKAGMKASIAEARKCHFSLGNDKIKYMSNTHSSMKLGEGHDAQEVAKNLENAKHMKTALQRTSIVIGDDENYY